MGNQTPGKILRILLEEGEKSRQELAVRMEMSVPAISQNIGLLERRGLARDGGMFDSTGGRKARIVSPVPDARYAIGLDVTENRLSGVLIDLSENIVEERQRKLRYENSPEYGAQAGELVRELLSARPRASEKTLGVGVSLPGILAHDRNTLAYSHILRVGGVPKEQFARTMELPIALVNDAKAAAIAECSVRRERGNAVYLSLSATVGGAVVLNGHVQEGNHQHSGEFGHMTLVPDGRRCYCGQYGCVDAYCACGSLTGGEPQGLDAFFAALQPRRAETTTNKTMTRTIIVSTLRFLLPRLNHRSGAPNTRPARARAEGFFAMPSLSAMAPSSAEICSSDLLSSLTFGVSGVGVEPVVSKSFSIFRRSFTERMCMFNQIIDNLTDKS